ETATIKLAATGGNYDDLDENFTVNITETDTRGITVSKTSMSLNEGNNDSFTVKLNSEPTQNTAINLTRSGLTADEVGLSSTSLAFTTSNWSTVQSVTVTANEDDDANDSAGSIILSSSGGDYGTENISSSVAVSVSDNDTVEIVHSSIQSIPEGSNRTLCKGERGPNRDVQLRYNLRPDLAEILDNELEYRSASDRYRRR
ncbi:MAG: hypothetical protein ISN28_13415, partial [Ectothiorhodospiraceae bacterium AqS1]|nr:hypothetical protein [Ectothiorhodospiraceae bacterium AqS1]